MLGNVGSTTRKSTSFVVWSSQCGYLSRCLLDRLPTIFYGGEVGQRMTVEVEFQPIWLLPHPYRTMFDFPSPWPESPSSSKTKFLMRFNPGIYNWLKNFGQCRPSDSSSCWLFSGQVPHRSTLSDLKSWPTSGQQCWRFFFVLLFWFFIFLDTIRTMSFPRLANNTQLALRAIAKMDLITKSRAKPIFWLGISFFHHLCPCLAIASCLLHLPSLFCKLYIR